MGRKKMSKNVQRCILRRIGLKQRIEIANKYENVRSMAAKLPYTFKKIFIGKEFITFDDIEFTIKKVEDSEEKTTNKEAHVKISQLIDFPITMLKLQFSTEPGLLPLFPSQVFKELIRYFACREGTLIENLEMSSGNWLQLFDQKGVVVKLLICPLMKKTTLPLLSRISMRKIIQCKYTCVGRVLLNLFGLLRSKCKPRIGDVYALKRSIYLEYNDLSNVHKLMEKDGPMKGFHKQRKAHGFVMLQCVLVDIEHAYFMVAFDTPPETMNISGRCMMVKIVGKEECKILKEGEEWKTRYFKLVSRYIRPSTRAPKSTLSDTAGSSSSSQEKDNVE